MQIGALRGPTREGVSIMRITTTTAAAVLAALVAQTSWAQSPVYKWIDASGTVNYASKPPKGVEAARVDLTESKLTVIPAVKISPTLAREEAQRSRDDAQSRARIESLEGELARERSARANETQREEQLMASWRERCNRDRFTDCDDNYALSVRYGGRFASPVPGYGYAYGGPTYIVPAPVIRPQQPFATTVPTPPSAVPSTNPPATMRRPGDPIPQRRLPQ
jgi:Domain of unknown function (DUF4124)